MSVYLHLKLKVPIIFALFVVHLGVALARSEHWLEVVVWIAQWGRDRIFILVYLRERLIVRFHVFSRINVVVYWLLQINIVDLLDLKKLILIDSPRILLGAIILIVSDLFLSQLESSLAHGHWYFILLVQTTMRSYCFQCLFLRSLLTGICWSYVLSLLFTTHYLDVFLLFLNIDYLIYTAHIVSLNHLLG